MKKIIVFVSMIVISISLFAATPNEGQGGSYYFMFTKTGENNLGFFDPSSSTANNFVPSSQFSFASITDLETASSSATIGIRYTIYSKSYVLKAVFSADHYLTDSSYMLARLNNDGTVDEATGLNFNISQATNSLNSSGLSITGITIAVENITNKLDVPNRTISIVDTTTSTQSSSASNTSSSGYATLNLTLNRPSVGYFESGQYVGNVYLVLDIYE